MKSYAVEYERGNSSELEHVVHTHRTSYLIFTSVSSVDRWVLVTFKIGAAQLLSVKEVAPKSPLFVIRILFVVWYPVSCEHNLIHLINEHKDLSVYD